MGRSSISNSPWANFFPTEIVDSVNIEFIVKKPKKPEVKIIAWDDKSKIYELPYVDTDKISKKITKKYLAGEIITDVDLKANNGQNLLDSMQYEVANDLADKLAIDDTQAIAKFATKIDIEDTTPVGYLKSMLSAWNTLFQFRNIANSKFFTDFSPHVLVEGIMKLNEFNNAFQTEQQCLAYIANLKENKCIRCFSFNLNTSDLKRMRCLKCNQTFSILTGTIFSRSQTSLTSWFYLIFRWINTKHGIPSTDIAKELGVTLKTAWRMTHKIRTRIAKQKPQFIVEGTVQIDEMYLSHMGFKKQGRSLVNKTLIVGIYQKTTNNLIVKVLKNAKSKNLLQFAKNHISSKCLVYTDSWKGYCDFKSVFTKHETVNHQDRYVSKIGVNTNQIESVWKHIRRTFKTHIKVAKHHVHLYAKEAAYKFNKIPSFETVMLCLI
ncbi:IS1595 family transposase [Spiroplasma ixodetis]|uniref:ISXO2-like transposase domain-containing protein n=1 Tax=Spiroplasma ixodetis TaxID=2141 RepID=A0ABM8BSI6_9MOLU|nr:IS1595 family transposase [Spiroplasma ixodetis]BDT02802.1 hypothetical protein SHM_04480 [Spiroplasma ixodetis]